MVDGDIERPFAAVYWTYPVPWAGFTDLPKDADAAAERSRTVRYQRDLVRTHVKSERGTLVREFVFLEVSPDHATDVGYQDVMRDIVALCKSRRVCLCYVDFGQQMGWRKHDRLKHVLRDEKIRTDPVWPLRIMIDGERFDPAMHFRAWRGVDLAFRERRAATAAEALASIADAVPAGYGRNVRIAERLNAEGVRTHNGIPWTSDNVRAALKKLSEIQDEG
jgi:hypothetical protein